MTFYFYAGKSWISLTLFLEDELVHFQADIADFLHCDMLIFEYPGTFKKKTQKNAFISGYGVSDGEVGERSIYKAIEAVFR